MWVHTSLLKKNYNNFIYSIWWTWTCRLIDANRKKVKMWMLFVHLVLREELWWEGGHLLVWHHAVWGECVHAVNAQNNRSVFNEKHCEILRHYRGSCGSVCGLETLCSESVSPLRLRLSAESTPIQTSCPAPWISGWTWRSFWRITARLTARPLSSPWRRSAAIWTLRNGETIQH